MWAHLVMMALVAAGDGPSAAVMRLEHKTGVTRETADLLTDNMVSELRASRAFSRIVSSSEIEAALDVERQRQLMDCSSVSCAADVAGALNVTFVVAGSAGKVGDAYLFNCKLVDARTGEAAGAVSYRSNGSSETALLNSVRPAVEQMLRNAGLRRGGGRPLARHAEVATDRVPVAVALPRHAVPRGSLELLNESATVRASSWKALPVQVPFAGTLRLEVSVTQGNDVDVYLVNQKEWQAIVAGRSFNHFPGFSTAKTRTLQRSGPMAEGAYYLAIHDDTLGVMSAASTDVRVKARLQR